MKPLIDYILEARETIGKLPFTRQQFKDFVQAVDDFDDDSDIWKEIESMVTSTYGEKVWNGFKGWVEGTQYGSDVDAMYDILCNLPKNRLEKILGAGSYGAAIELSNGLVCKIFHKNTPMEKSDRKFFEYCMKNKTNVFPNVRKLGSNFVVMDKLKTNTPKCRLYDKYLGFSAIKVADGYTMNDLVMGVFKGDKKLIKIADKLQGEEKEILNWGVEALTHLKAAVGYTEFSDLRLVNLGERADGAIIWFDI